MNDTPGRVTLWAIETFLAAAGEGTVQGAARRLNASASGVSQQITALEAALGATLFDRSARPLRLTPAGETFRPHAQAIVNELAAARAAIGLAGLSGRASFRLGIIEDFESEVTPRLLSDLGRKWPESQFLLETGPSHQLHAALEARGLDLILASDPGSVTDHTEVHMIVEEPFVAVVPKGVKLALDDPGLPLILYTSRHLMGRQIADALARQKQRLQHRFELDSYNAIMAMVAAGAGWSILTPLGALHAERYSDRVELQPLPFAPFSRRIALFSRRDVLGELPSDIAERLRQLISTLIVKPAVADHPWMKGGLRVIDP